MQNNGIEYIYLNIINLTGDFPADRIQSERWSANEIDRQFVTFPGPLY